MGYAPAKLGQHVLWQGIMKAAAYLENSPRKWDSLGKGNIPAEAIRNAQVPRGLVTPYAAWRGVQGLIWLDLNTCLQSSCNCMMYYLFSRLDLWLWQTLASAREMLIRAQCAEQREQSWLFCPEAQNRENTGRYYHESSHTRVVTCCPDSVLWCLYCSTLIQHDRMSCSKPKSTGRLVCAVLLSHPVTELISSSPNAPIIVSQQCKMVEKSYWFWLNVVFSPPSSLC